MTTTAPKTLTVGNTTYAIRHAPATTSLRALGVLANAFGPLVDGMAKGGATVDEAMAAGVGAILRNPHIGADTIELCQMFAPYTEIMIADPSVPGGARSFSLSGKTAEGGSVFDDHFAGNMMALFLWVKASVDHNLGNFLGETGKLLAAKSPKRQQAADSPSSNSSGPSSALTNPGSGA